MMENTALIYEEYKSMAFFRVLYFNVEFGVLHICGGMIMNFSAFILCHADFSYLADKCGSIITIERNNTNQKV